MIELESRKVDKYKVWIYSQHNALGLKFYLQEEFVTILDVLSGIKFLCEQI